MKRSLEQAWREISTDLDEVLDLDAGARQAWLDTLQTRDPDRAQRVRDYMLDLEKLEKDNFLGQALPSILPANPSLAGRRLGSYTVDRAIGRGGMGTVWLAHRSDGRFEGDVAIKLLHTSPLGGGGEDRFVREGHLLAKLEHPNIARLIDAGVSDTGQPLLVLEYVRGKPITDYCDGERLDIRARVELFLSVLAAVSHAHSRLVIHRDLKPANIFVTADGIVKLLDFGIATLTGPEGGTPADLTRLGSTALTLTYASPEQIRGADIGTASDIYSLGCCSMSSSPAHFHTGRSAIRSAPSRKRSCARNRPRRAGWVSATATRTSGGQRRRS
jgi:serine/threonine protein kinase